MENSLVQILNKPTIAQSVSTGTEILQSFKAASGFNYQVGLREAAGLYILEGFAEGTGCSFLNKIVVILGENKEMIADIVLPKGTHYSREVAMNIVKEKLCRYFLDACRKENLNFSREEIEQ